MSFFSNRLRLASASEHYVHEEIAAEQYLANGGGKGSNPYVHGEVIAAPYVEPEDDSYDPNNSYGHEEALQNKDDLAKEDSAQSK